MRVGRDVDRRDPGAVAEGDVVTLPQWILGRRALQYRERIPQRLERYDAAEAVSSTG